MRRHHFDKLDLRILTLLSGSARKPFLEIARECGVSGAAIHQRIQKLLKSGIIKSFESCVSPEALGYDTCAYIGFFLSDNTRMDEVIEALKKIPEIVECHFTTGKYDIFIKVYTRSNEDLLRFIQNRLQPIGISRTETIISFKEEIHRQVAITLDNE